MQFYQNLKKIIYPLFKHNLQLSNQHLHFLNYMKNHMQELINFYYMLADEDSKTLLIRLLQYRISLLLNSDPQQFSLYSNQEWAYFIKQAENLPHCENDYFLDRVETFILNGYSYKDVCLVEENDIVLDCGAFTGNTAIYFADRCGSNGKVHAFEPMPQTFDILCKNIEKQAKQNVICHNLAISDSNSNLNFTNCATPGSHISSGADTIQVIAKSIDNFIKENDLTKINFIKMDIEGAELQALAGAENAIKTYHPKLAICVYHKISDLILIPNKIKSFCPNYQFYLKHNSNTHLETVLFAKYAEQPLDPTPIDQNEYINCLELWNLPLDIFQNLSYLDRKFLLEQINDSLANMANWRLEPEFHNDYRFLYYPISDDRRLHYEFIFDGNNIQISLHFEGNWEPYRDEIHKQLKNESNFGNLLTSQNANFGKLLYISVDKNSGIYKISHLMDLLMDKTIPILAKNNLLGSKFLMNNLKQISPCL